MKVVFVLIVVIVSAIFLLSCRSVNPPRLNIPVRNLTDRDVSVMSSCEFILYRRYLNFISADPGSWFFPKFYWDIGIKTDENYGNKKTQTRWNAKTNMLISSPSYKTIEPYHHIHKITNLLSTRDVSIEYDKDDFKIKERRYPANDGLVYFDLSAAIGLNAELKEKYSLNIAHLPALPRIDSWLYFKGIGYKNFKELSDILFHPVKLGFEYLLPTKVYDQLDADPNEVALSVYEVKDDFSLTKDENNTYSIHDVYVVDRIYYHLLFRCLKLKRTEAVAQITNRYALANHPAFQMEVFREIASQSGIYKNNYREIADSFIRDGLSLDSMKVAAVEGYSLEFLDYLLLKGFECKTLLQHMNWEKLMITRSTDDIRKFLRDHKEFASLEIPETGETLMDKCHYSINYITIDVSPELRQKYGMNESFKNIYLNQFQNDPGATGDYYHFSVYLNGELIKETADMNPLQFAFEPGNEVLLNKLISIEEAEHLTVYYKDKKWPLYREADNHYYLSDELLNNKIFGWYYGILDQLCQRLCAKDFITIYQHNRDNISQEMANRMLNSLSYNLHRYRRFNLTIDNNNDFTNVLGNLKSITKFLIDSCGAKYKPSVKVEEDYNYRDHYQTSWLGLIELGQLDFINYILDNGGGIHAGVIKGDIKEAIRAHQNPTMGSEFLSYTFSDDFELYEGQRFYGGDECIFWAVYFKQKEITQYLLKRGAIAPTMENPALRRRLKEYSKQ